CEMRRVRLGAALAMVLMGGCATEDPSALRGTLLGDGSVSAAAQVRAAEGPSQQVAWKRSAQAPAEVQVVWRGAAPESDMEAQATPSSWRPVPMENAAATQM